MSQCGSAYERLSEVKHMLQNYLNVKIQKCRVLTQIHLQSSMTLHSGKCIPEVTEEQLDSLHRKKTITPGKMVSKMSMHHKTLIM